MARDPKPGWARVPFCGIDRTLEYNELYWGWDSNVSPLRGMVYGGNRNHGAGIPLLLYAVWDIRKVDYGFGGAHALVVPCGSQCVFSHSLGEYTTQR